MFDTINRTQREYVPYTKEVNVHEHRAPTDDSVRLMNEMTDKATKNIVDRLIIDSNELKAVGISMVSSRIIHAGGTQLLITFKLNGKKYYVEKELIRDELTDINKTFIHLIFNKISEIIAEALIRENEHLFSNVKRY